MLAERPPSGLTASVGQSCVLFVRAVTGLAQVLICYSPSPHSQDCLAD